MRRSFLIWADDPLFRAAVKASLTRAGYAAWCLSGCDAALRCFAAGESDLLFCDLGTNEPMRLALLHDPALRPLWSRVLLSTDGHGLETALDAFRREGGEVVPKPLRFSELLAAAGRLALRLGGADGDGLPVGVPTPSGP